MRIVSLSYAINNRFTDPDAWLRRIGFFKEFLAELRKYAEVTSFHFIGNNSQMSVDGVRFIFLRRNHLQLVFPFRVHAMVKGSKPDILIVHGIGFSWQILLLRLQLGSQAKIIVQHHAERPYSGLRAFLQRIADKQIDAYLFSAIEQGRLWVIRKLISDVTKIHEFVEVSSAFAPAERQDSRQATKVTGQPVYLWVGRLDVNKDPVTVVKAFMRYRETHKAATLYMIYQTKELLSKLETLRSTHPSLGEAIHFVGRVDHTLLQAWYNSADFIVCGSHYEGGGTAVCEGMSCGCIPIVTNIPSLVVMTGRGSCGLVYPAGDEDALFATLQESSELDIELEKSKVLKHFHNRLSFDANARLFMKLFLAG
jgi:glycosyltransferase involved in cell wall biosynthesis